MNNVLLHFLIAISFMNTAHLEEIRKKPVVWALTSRIIGIAFGALALAGFVHEILA